MHRIIGVPFDFNSSYMRGPAQAPDFIRKMETDGAANCFNELGQQLRSGLEYEDEGNIHFSSDDDPEAAYHLIKDTITRTLKKNGKLLSIGGDHSVSYPIIEAHAQKYPNLHVLHFDAHGDIYENFDDNPYSHASPFARILEKKLISSLTQVGLRTLNTHQREQINKYGIQVIEMKDFSMDFLNKLSGPLYISLDIDVLDPAFAPGVSHHEPGGMSVRELISCLQGINVEVVGADLVEYNPLRDINNQTAMVGYKLMKELLGLFS